MSKVDGSARGVVPVRKDELALIEDSITGLVGNPE